MPSREASPADASLLDLQPPELSGKEIRLRKPPSPCPWWPLREPVQVPGVDGLGRGHIRVSSAATAHSIRAATTTASTEQASAHHRRGGR